VGDRPVSIAARRRLARLSVGVGVGVMLAGLALSLLFGPLPTAARVAPLLVGGALVGLPHGAVDWAAVGLARQGMPTVHESAAVGVVYAVLVPPVLAAWVLAPVPFAIAFVALTWAHWGQGDLHAVGTVYRATLGGPVSRAVVGCCRGGLPMVVPLLAFPDAYRRFLRALVAPLGVDPSFAWLAAPSVRAGLGIAMLAMTAAALATARWDRRRTAAIRAIELGTLWATFLLVSPLVAVGLYFLAWHSVRHLARVWLLDGPSTAAIAAGTWTAPLVRLAAAATPPTLAALGLVWLLFLVVPVPPASPTGFAAVGLVAVAALTVPHVVVVTWMDRLEGAGEFTPAGAGR
jgi:Brp/Blh family beta-carotene 15,15'-monooxygenase